MTPSPASGETADAAAPAGETATDTDPTPAQTTTHTADHTPEREPEPDTDAATPAPAGGEDGESAPLPDEAIPLDDSSPPTDGARDVEQSFGDTAELAVTDLEVTGTTTLYTVGETSDLSVTAVLSDGSRQAVDGAQVFWVSTDTAVLTVSEGTLTAIGRGNAWISITYSQETVNVPVWVRAPAVVRVLYVVPSDREFRSDYSEAIETAVRGMQSWYRRQLDGLTFSLGEPVPQHCRMSHPSDFYTRHPWDKIVADVQHCAPIGYGSAGFSWVIYADVVNECGLWEQGFNQLGRGTVGLTIMARHDLTGLAGEDVEHYYCWAGTLHGPVDFPHGRWEGGGAHELGHTFGLLHPPGCDEGTDTCDDDALMFTGFYAYPDTYLRPEEKEALSRSAFFGASAPPADEPSGTRGRPAVTGSVVDPDGAPVAGVRVSLVADAFWAWAQTDPDGGFAIRLPAGSAGPAALSVHAGEAADCGWFGYHAATGLTTRRREAGTVTADINDPARVVIALPASVEQLCRT